LRYTIKEGNTIPGSPTGLLRFFSYEKDNNRVFCTLSKTFDSAGLIKGIIHVTGDNNEVYSGYSEYLLKNGIGRHIKPDG